MEKMKRLYFSFFTIILIVSLVLLIFLEPNSGQFQVTLYCTIISAVMIVIISIMIRKDYKKELKRR